MNPYDTIKLCCGPLCAECETKIETLTRELTEARSQRDGLVEWVHIWDDMDHCRCCNGHGRHKPDCKLKAALDAAKGGA